MIERNKSTRIRWTHDERQKFIEHGAQLLNEKPSWKDVDIVRQAMNALPPNRRRDVLSTQPFTKELEAMKVRAPMLRKAREEGAASPDEEHERVLDVVLTAGRSDAIDESPMAIAGRYFLQAIKEELTASSPPAQVAQEIARIPEILGELEGFGARLDRIETALFSLCTAWEVEIAQKQPAPATQEESIAESARTPQTDPQSRPRVAKLRLTVVGVRGRQIESLRSLVQDAPVDLTCVQAGSGEALHSKAGRMLIWTSKVGHRDTNSNPNAVQIRGGFGKLKAAVIKEVDAWRQAQS